MKIVFTEVAENRLKDIYQYYKQVSTIKIAKSVKNKILKGIRGLKTHPKIGSEELYLSYLKPGYRKLIIGNYKAIYRIIENEIIIDTIFDTRQEPDELKTDIKRTK